MTESDIRQMYITKAKLYLGVTEGSTDHHDIVDTYNTIRPLPVGYVLKYNDDWCAGFVSAIGKLCGMTDVILPECSCTRMIALYNAVGRFVENDAYIPDVGDLIMYDWQDSGVGDFTGDADHVGIVVSCDGSTIKVIEGNTSNNNVGYREISVNGRYIRGFCTPDFASKATDPDPGDQETYNPKRVWDFLMLKIGNEYGVAGLMGNLEAESTLHSDILQGDNPISIVSKTYTSEVNTGIKSEHTFVNDSKGYGLAQWTYSSRKQALYNMYKTGGYSSIGSLALALDYLWYELNNDYPGVLAVLKSATSIRVASDKVLHDFESPADQSVSVEVKRASMGQAWYDKYHGSEPDPDPGDPDPDPGTRPPWIPTNRKKMPLIMMVVASRRRR